MIIFLYGKDTYRSRTALEKMREKFRKERDPQGYNIARIDCMTEKDSVRIFADMFAAPFLATRRFVVVESLLSSKHADVRKELTDRMEKKNISEENVLVFWEGTDVWKQKDATALAHVLAKEKFSQLFDILEGARLVSWIASLVSESGGTISERAARSIADRVPDDSWYVHSSVMQLVAYANGRMIEEKDVDIFLNPSVDDSVFTLVDAAIAGKSKDAFAMIREQYRIGEDVQFIFAMLMRQFKIFLQIRDMLNRDVQLTSDQIATILKLHPFVVKKSLPMTKRYSMNDFICAYRALLDFDIGIKKGFGAPEALLDAFVARLPMFLSSSLPLRLPQTP